ncbi:MAG TPA: amylo-alpha-1,6-glucosidase [Actinomycetota bacterium]|nr:amylo-alpha-1,6-glucosidase [Actinomycetota bacterium]
MSSRKSEEPPAPKGAGPIGKLLSAPAITAQSGGDRLVIKEGRIFLRCGVDGDINPKFGGDGLYSDDTRFLSELQIQVNGHSPVALSASAVLGYAMTVNSTNPEIVDNGNRISQQTLSIARHRFIADRLYEQIAITNFGQKGADVDIEITLGSDFADTFEVRRVRQRHVRGKEMPVKRSPKGFALGYLGEDDVLREAVVQWTHKPKGWTFDDDGRAHLLWSMKLGAGEQETVGYSIEPSVGGETQKARSFKTALSEVRAAHDKWLKDGSSISTNNDTFNAIVGSSIRDLKALLTPIGDEGLEVITAGIPWFVAPFGRDSLITCYEMIMFNAEPARQTLLYLAANQADKDEAWRDAEPGKILHEVRSGELAGAGVIPHTPYYGSIDSTPLFLLLASAYYRWTNDIETIEHLRPSLEKALSWIDAYGDMDGDGFVEYARRSEAGLVAQGWKDSFDSIVHADGSIAEVPVALAEVQGYVFLAKSRMAEVMRLFGDDARADELEKQAAQLKKAFNETFWMPDEGTFALGLDSSKKLIRSVTSNPGHCLYCGIVDRDKAASVVERLMAPDMFSGWGIRTLSKDSKAYNPMSYHNGSVWPHDNALIAAGFKRYGFHQDTNTIASVLFDAAATTREARLPELYCGFDREEGIPFVDYPVACSPQAWAAAAPIVLLQAILGISARAPDGVLTVNHPTLPTWLGQVEIGNLKVGASKLHLSFHRDRDRTSFALMEREGNVAVSVEE